MAGKTITSRLIVTLLDEVSGPAAKAGAALKKLQGAANFATAPIAQHMQRLGKAAGSFRDSLMGPGGIAAAFAAVDLTHQFSKYTEHLNRIRAATLASAEDMKALQDNIAKVAKQHGVRYDEVAGGALQLIKSGRTLHETMGALDATVGTSVAVEKSVEHVAETLTDIIYGLGLRAESAKEAMETFGYVADVATASSFKFNQTFDDQVRSLAKGAPMARVLGMNLLQISTLMGVSGDEGFKGAKGGAAFSTAMMRIIGPTKKAQAELAAAGLNLSEFVHKTKSSHLDGKTLAAVLSEDIGVDADALIPKLDKILKDPHLNSNATNLGRELQKAIVAGLEMDANGANVEKARDAVDLFLRSSFSKVDTEGLFKYLAAHDADKIVPLMRELVGIHHTPAIMALINAFRDDPATGLSLYSKQLKAMEEQAPGAVHRHETANLEGLSGALKKIGAAWGLVGKALFETGGAAENLTAMLNGMTNALNAFEGASPAVLKFAGYAVTALAASVALGLSFEALKIATSGLRLAFVALSGPIGWIVAGLGALAYFNWDAVKAKWNDFSSSFQKGWADNLAVPADVAKSWDDLKKAIESVSGAKPEPSVWAKIGETLGGAAAEGVTKLANAFKALAEAATAAINSINARIAAAGNIMLGGGGNDIMRASPNRLPGKAAGGPVTGGAPYLVGEAGPELFVPRTSGGIVPNGKLGGGNTVTVQQTFHVNATGDIRTIVAELKREMRHGLDELFRTAQADVGLRWS